MFTPSRSTKPSLSGSFARITSPRRRSGFCHTNEISEAPERLAHRHALLLAAEQIEALRTHECAADERGNLFGRKWADSTELALRFAPQLGEQIKPGQQSGADNAGNIGVSPTRRRQLLQHAHVAGGNVVVEVVASLVPLLRQLQVRII